VRTLLLSTTTAIMLSVLSGCMTTKIRQHTIDCNARSKADILRSATTLLVQSGFTVTLADTVVGLVQAETAEQYDIWSGTNSRRVWQISIRSDVGQTNSTTGGAMASSALPGAKPLHVIATARTINRGQNAFGATSSTSEVYYDDSAHEDWEWYWDVRKGLETMCGAKAIITTKNMH